MCLLQLLFDLQSKWRWRLGVVHCDHGWRQDSAANAAFVRQLAEVRMGLPYYERVAPAGTPKTERAARDWRYAVFAEVAAAHGYSTVVTAHTATDRWGSGDRNTIFIPFAISFFAKRFSQSKLPINVILGIPQIIS